MWLIGVISNHIDREVHYFLHSDVSLLSWIPFCHPATIIQSTFLVFSFMIWMVTEAEHLPSSVLWPLHVGSSSLWSWQRGCAMQNYSCCISLECGVFSVSHCMSRTLPGVGNRKRAKHESWSSLIWRRAHLGENLWYKCVQQSVCVCGGGGATHSKFTCTGNLLELGTVFFIQYQAYHTLEMRNWEWVGLFHCSLCVQVIQKSCLLFLYVNCA